MTKIPPGERRQNLEDNLVSIDEKPLGIRYPNKEEFHEMIQEFTLFGVPESELKKIKEAKVGETIAGEIPGKGTYTFTRTKEDDYEAKLDGPAMAERRRLHKVAQELHVDQKNKQAFDALSDFGVSIEELDELIKISDPKASKKSISGEVSGKGKWHAEWRDDELYIELHPLQEK